MSLPQPREGIGLNDVGMYEVWHGGKMIARVNSQSQAGAIYWEARSRTEMEIQSLRA